jgi:hypothetical protein
VKTWERVKAIQDENRDLKKQVAELQDTALYMTEVMQRAFLDGVPITKVILEDKAIVSCAGMQVHLPLPAEMADDEPLSPEVATLLERLEAGTK